MFVKTDACVFALRACIMCVLFRRWLLFPEAHNNFRAVVAAFPASINIYVRDPITTGKVFLNIWDKFSGDIPYLFAVDVDTEGGRALPFITLQRQFHIAFIKGRVFEVDFAKDCLTAFAPILEGYACNLNPQKIKAVLGILRGLLFFPDRRRAGNSGGGRRGLGFRLLRSRRHIYGGDVWPCRFGRGLPFSQAHKEEYDGNSDPAHAFRYFTLPKKRQGTQQEEGGHGP